MMKRIVPFLILVVLFCLGCTSGSKTSEGSENNVDTVRVVKRETFVVPRQELIDAYNQIHENVVWKSLQAELEGKALRDSMMNGVETLKAIVEQEPLYSLAYTLLVQFQYALKQYDEMFAHSTRRKRLFTMTPMCLLSVPAYSLIWDGMQKPMSISEKPLP